MKRVDLVKKMFSILLSMILVVASAVSMTIQATSTLSGNLALNCKTMASHDIAGLAAWNSKFTVDGSRTSINGGAYGWITGPAVEGPFRVVGTTGNWLTVDLGNERKICQVNLYAASDAGDPFPNTFTLQVSTDNENWTTVASPVNYNGGIKPTGAQIFSFDEVLARYVKIDIDSTYNPSTAAIAEFEVYGQGYDVVNVAKGKMATASHDFINNVNWSAQFTIDGNRGIVNGKYGWTALTNLAHPMMNRLPDTTGVWFMVNLGRTYTVDSLALFTRDDDLSTAVAETPKNFDILVSLDGDNWTTVKQVRNLPVTSIGRYTVSFDKVEAAYIKLDMSVESKDTYSFSEIEVYSELIRETFLDNEALMFNDDFDGNAIISQLNDWGSLCTTNNGSGALVGKDPSGAYAFATAAAIGGNNSIYRVKTGIKTISKAYTGATYIGMRAPSISGNESSNGIWYVVGLNGDIGVSETNYGDASGHKMLDYSSIGLNFNNTTDLYFDDDTATNTIKVYAEIEGRKVLLMTSIISYDGKTVKTYRPSETVPFSTMDKTSTPIQRSGLMIWWTISSVVQWDSVAAYSVERDHTFTNDHFDKTAWGSGNSEGNKAKLSFTADQNCTVTLSMKVDKSLGRSTVEIKNEAGDTVYLKNIDCFFVTSSWVDVTFTVPTGKYTLEITAAGSNYSQIANVQFSDGLGASTAGNSVIFDGVELSRGVE